MLASGPGPAQPSSLFMHDCQRAEVSEEEPERDDGTRGSAVPGNKYIHDNDTSQTTHTRQHTHTQTHTRTHTQTHTPTHKHQHLDSPEVLDRLRLCVCGAGHRH